MNEKDLYKAIIEVWGEHGAHADVYRELCKRASVALTGPMTVEQLAQAAKEAHPESKLQAIKQFRWAYEDAFGVCLDLKATVQAYEQALST